MAHTKKSESAFQAELIRDLKKIFTGCLVMKLDSSYIQGIPDLLILYRDKWAALEVKKSCNAKHRPNQDHYVSMMAKMAFARFIYPENKNEVIRDLKKYFLGE